MPKFLAEIHADAGIDGYFSPISYHFPGAVSTGLKTPEYLAPVAMEITLMYGRVSAGSGVTYRPVKNGATNGTTSGATGTTSVSTGQSLSLAAGDRLQLEVVNAGSGASNLSVTTWAKVT